MVDRMTLLYRTTDINRWGVGLGANLSASQIDNNFYELDKAIKLIAPVNGVGISSIDVTDSQFTVRMTDGTVSGPFTLPVAKFSTKGAWTPTTPYKTNDLITALGAVYIVQKDHTSAASFVPGANDGLGNNYYGLLFDPPYHQVPTGGSRGNVLAKTGSNDTDYDWATINPVPNGGVVGQYLAKKSSTDGDMQWKTPNEIPAGGAAGTVLRKSSAADFNADWSSTGLVPAGGASGYVLKKAAASDYALAWSDPHDLSMSYLNISTSTFEIDTSLGEVLSINVSVDSTVTFKIPVINRPLVLIFQNGSGANKTVTFSGVKSSGSVTVPSDPSKYCAVTFVPVVGTLYETARVVMV